MLSCHMQYRGADQSRFYRLEVCENLFREYSLVSEWGRAGTPARQRIRLFGNLREACSAAEAARRRQMRRGFGAEAVCVP